MRTVLFHWDFFAYTPAAAASALNDEYIVLIQMRAYTTAGDRVGDHQVVHAPVRNVAERAHQMGRGLVPVINGLNQNRPVVFTQMIITFKRPVTHLPAAILMTDQAAVDFVFHRQTGQLIRGERVNKIFEATFKNNRTFLPVTL